MRGTLAALTLVLGLTAGCASTGGAADSDPPTGDNADASSDSSAPANEDKPKDEPNDDTLDFGQAYTYDDGLTVKVTDPKPFKPSQYAVTGKVKNHVAFTVTLVNKTGKTFDPALVYMTMQSGNAEAEQIFDSAKGLSGQPSTKLLDGREAQFRAGFSVKNPNDLVLEFSPDAGMIYQPVIWQR